MASKNPVTRHLRPRHFAAAMWLAQSHGSNVVRVLRTLPEAEDEHTCDVLEAAARVEAQYAAHFFIEAQRKLGRW